MALLSEYFIKNNFLITLDSLQRECSDKGFKPNNKYIESFRQEMVEVIIMFICRLLRKVIARPSLVDSLNMSQCQWELGTCKPWNSNSIFKSISLFMEFTHSWVRKEIFKNTQKIVLSLISKEEEPLLQPQQNFFSTTRSLTFKSPKKMQLSRPFLPKSGSQS